MTKIYEKYKELDIDPFKIKFKNIILKEIISYPPAQNDVVEAICKYKDSYVNLIIKIERSKLADFSSEISSLKKLKNLGIKNIPEIIEYGKFNNKNYMVLSKIEGERLSDILKENDGNKNKYLLEYGRTLAKIHNLKLKENINIAMQRKINNYPKIEDYKEIPLSIIKYVNYLKNNEPKFNFDTFIHGDFHYANVLWDNNKISGLLDWEYSGLGFKEQDMAWSCILRPTQEFMDNIEDIKCFLKGYLEIGEFDINNLKWCLINGYCHFYLMNLNNEEYKAKLEILLENILY